MAYLIKVRKMKKTLLLFLLMAVFGFACTSNVSSEKHPEKTSQVNKPELPSAAGKSSKMRRHRLPEGVISVDIASSKGRLHLLLGKHEQGKKTLLYQNSDDQGVTWSVPAKVVDTENLQANINRGNDAQIAVQGDTIVVTWMRYVEAARFHAGPMQAARSTDGGKTWQASATPPDWAKGPHGYTDLAADEQAFHAVWLDTRGKRSKLKASQSLRYAKSEDGGLTWLANNTLDEVTCSCCWNTVKSDSDNKAYVLYRDKQPSDLAIGVVDTQQHWQRLNNVGAFNWQFDGCPHIGGDFDFQTVAGKTVMHSVVGTGHADHLGVHYTRSENKGENWSPTIQLGDESALHANIAAGDDGRVVAVWDMNAEQGLGIFVSESVDQGTQWSKPIQISESDSRASHPIVIKTKTGFFSVWTEHDGKQQKINTRSL